MHIELRSIRTYMSANKYVVCWRTGANKCWRTNWGEQTAYSHLAVFKSHAYCNYGHRNLQIAATRLNYSSSRSHSMLAKSSLTNRNQDSCVSILRSRWSWASWRVSVVRHETSRVGNNWQRALYTRKVHWSDKLQLQSARTGQVEAASYCLNSPRLQLTRLHQNYKYYVTPHPHSAFWWSPTSRRPPSMRAICSSLLLSFAASRLFARWSPFQNLTLFLSLIGKSVLGFNAKWPTAVTFVVSLPNFSSLLSSFESFKLLHLHKEANTNFRDYDLRAIGVAI